MGWLKRGQALLVIGLMAVAGCTEADDGVGRTAPDAGDETAKPDSGAPAGICEGLFGRPTDKTGLGDDECSPDIGTFAAPRYNSGQLAALEGRVLMNPPLPLTGNPYDDPDAHPGNADAFCAVMPEPDNPDGYRLAIFDSIDDAENAGGTVTHHGACGACSSLQDLAVYIRNNDLTGPVRMCSLAWGLVSAEKNLECIEDIGFTPVCAQAWFFNSENTRQTCLSECLGGLKAKYNEPDGALNSCLSCDEQKSGPIFKATAGRTRRNSGLPTAICRPCDGVAPIIHDY